MKLRFNEGAIVELSLLGVANPNVFTGKVVKVLEDEVQICPQLRVLKLGDEKQRWQGNMEDEFCTADDKEVIHLNRQLIQSWRYIKATEIHAAAWFREMVEDFSIKDCSLNYYDTSTGLCKGSGAYCGDIEEHYDTPILIKTQDDNGIKDDGLGKYIWP